MGVLGGESDSVNMSTIVHMLLNISTIVRLIAKRVNIIGSLVGVVTEFSLIFEPWLSGIKSRYGKIKTMYMIANFANNLIM